MAETTLKRGDTVKLKSGSCDMTVSEVITKKEQSVSNPTSLPDNFIDVEYFWEGEIKKARFYESQITKS
ncbi:hypothetical protein ATE47_04080 [Chryseobacterium sp. IHB B 17019]|uniref:hypothetical protein n=1 Tax=Chryseobacterium sp. IHB B 17019 TaxID=1721091 RepID=UPI00071F0018|nr:hypothetical protein [Chryseobacterium sp. IHB B 17019]ALR29748.1 hypothetical protein ATE47_04080 [Chryseobacterium sp. IHB B 17019]